MLVYFSITFLFIYEGIIHVRLSLNLPPFNISKYFHSICFSFTPTVFVSEIVNYCIFRIAFLLRALKSQNVIFSTIRFRLNDSLQ